MSHERYRSDLAVGLEELATCGWQEAIRDVAEAGYSALSNAIANAAQKATEEKQAKVLWLLAGASSMILKPAARHQPFQPFFVMENSRSLAIDDFTDADIKFFADASPEIDNNWLSARLADIVWTRKRAMGVRYPLLAIDAYIQTPLNVDAWVGGGSDCWKRAVELTLFLGKAGGARIQEIETQVLKAFDVSTLSDGFWALWLAELLTTARVDKPLVEKIGSKLLALAEEFDACGDLHRARDYYGAAAKRLAQSGHPEKAASATSLLAECWVKEAKARLESATPSYMAAASFYEDAIHELLRIPRRQREPMKVDERLAELRRLLADAAQKSMGEFGTIQTPPVDLREAIEDAENEVSNKTLGNALLALSHINKITSVDRLKEQAMRALREYPLQAMMPRDHVAADGRVVARRPGVDLMADPASEEFRTALGADMVRIFDLEVQVVVQARILPALSRFSLEHRINEEELFAVTDRSPFVPYGRAALVAKGLFAGFEHDFATSTHLLTPQFEHMVRMQLKSAGEITTTQDANGIVMENGLSSLMEMPKVNEIFGPDLAFEIRSLFCNPFGANLRNEVAHGLVDDRIGHSAPAIYAWWLIFRLVFAYFAHAKQVEREQAKAQWAAALAQQEQSADQV